MAERSDRPKVLVVDDEHFNRELIRRILQRQFEVLEAEDVAGALSRLEEESFDLILCDQLMPGQHGTELAKIVRERWPGVPFLLLTGFDGDEEVQRAQESGLVRSVIAKPWRGSELSELISRSLEEGDNSTN